MAQQYEHKSAMRTYAWGMGYVSCAEFVNAESDPDWELVTVAVVDAALTNHKAEIFYFRRIKKVAAEQYR